MPGQVGSRENARQTLKLFLQLTISQAQCSPPLIAAADPGGNNTGLASEALHCEGVCAGVHTLTEEDEGVPRAIRGSGGLGQGG